MHVPTIPSLDQIQGQAVAARIDELTKPRGSLGQLEVLAIRLAKMGPLPAHGYTKRAVLIGAGDHGVTAEDVSAYPTDVTQAMVAAFLAGFAAINAFARSAAATVNVVDFGMRITPAPQPGLLMLSSGNGTANLAQEPALSVMAAERALLQGIEAANMLCAQSEIEIVALGEMGIGNTTSAAALIATLTGADAAAVVGRGTGVEGERLENKRRIVAAAVAQNRAGRRSLREQIAAVGGYESFGLAGAIIGFAARRIPILLDGVSLGAAALIAREYAPAVLDYTIAAHESAEPGHGVALSALGLRPLLKFDLRLGEATGATLAFGICDAAARMVTEMRTFTEAGVAQAKEIVHG